MRTHALAAAMCGLAFLAVAGCDNTPKTPTPDLAQVSGTVTLDGKPLPDAAVMIGMSRGSTDANGHYEMTYSEGKKGVPVGKHPVVIDKWVTADGSHYKGEESPEMAGAKQLIPPKYSDPSGTTLSIEVPAAGGTFDFDLKSA